MEKYITNYKENLLKVSEEMKIRNNVRLIDNSPELYLTALENKFPNEYKFIDKLNKHLPIGFIDSETQLIITIPVAGFGNQEKDNIKQTIKLLSEDEWFKSWNVRILIFSNRPEWIDWDDTKKEIQDYIKYIWINNLFIWIIEWELQDNLWRADGPFNDEMAIDKKHVPIWFIRDVMNITIAIQAKWNDIPVLQMDWDFYGFKNWWLKDIIDIFSQKNCTFLQCKSDWDWIIRTQDFPLLKFWSDLMAELPMILKEKINNNNNYESLEKIVFSDAIQRWIQVPQVELLSQIIMKGWYWLLRLASDELDLNLRSACLMNPNWLRNTWDVTFLRDNRRAIATLLEYNIPPISQRKNWFEANDKVRAKQSFDVNTIIFTKANLLKTLNFTLDRFVIPEAIDGVYEDWWKEILKVLENIWINGEASKLIKNREWFVKTQFYNISNYNFNYLKRKYNVR